MEIEGIFILLSLSGLLGCIIVTIVMFIQEYCNRKQEKKYRQIINKQRNEER